MNGRALRFLADESCDFAAVRALRRAGYDVMAVVETMAGTRDQEVLQVAVATDRILLTEDKDFGEWVFAHREAIGGVLLIRFPAAKRATMPAALLELVSNLEKDLEKSYVVLEPGRARIRRI